MPNYLKIIADCFPGTQAYTDGDPLVYNDIVWISSPIEQSVLDASDCANMAPLDLGTGSLNGVFQAGDGVGFWYGPIPFQSGTTTYSSYDNAPPYAEGTEIWSIELTPHSLESVFTISFALQLDSSKSCDIMCAVYRNSDLVGASMRYCSGADKPGNMHLQFTDRPVSSTPVTYSARIGKVATAGTWYINRSKSYTVGDSLQQHFVILENSF